MNVTEICNMALAYLGKGRISSIDEQTETARQCKLFYSYTKKKLLREYAWGFAKRSERLAQLDSVVPAWEYVYAYPSKCIAVRKIYSCEETLDVINRHIRVVESKHIMPDEKDKYEILMISDNVLGVGCDVAQAWLDYTYDVDDADMFSPDFVEALTHLLASNMAIQLTGNMNMKQSEFQLAQNSLRRAQYTAAAEDSSKPERPSTYFDARR